MFNDVSEKRVASIQQMKIQAAGLSDTSVTNYKHSVVSYKSEIFRHKRVLYFYLSGIYEIYRHSILI